MALESQVKQGNGSGTVNKGRVEEQVIVESRKSQTNDECGVEQVSAEDIPSFPGNNHILRHDLKVRLVDIADLRELGKATRKHSHRQIAKIVASLNEFGFVLPIAIDAAKRVIAGWGLVLAARKMQMQEVPCVSIGELSEAQLRALRLALNRIGEDSSWDQAALHIELSEIVDLDPHIDLSTTGFDAAEIDISLYGDGSAEEDDWAPSPVVECRTRPGDVWVLGDHKLLCGNSLQMESYSTLLGEEKAEMILSDPPYNVRIEGNVSGLGTTQHQEFAMASGEMSSSEFTEFLRQTFALAADWSVDGSLHFWFMDWRHMKEMLSAGEPIYSELKNVCVWSKTNGGMGSLYRSAHELVFVYKKGKAPHINNILLGKHGRNRKNVWTYAGQTALAGRKNKLALHPTVKPVGMIADAIRDCSTPNGIILDPFGGAGTTLIAAERTGRKARLIEIDPQYVEISVKRWEALTGKSGVLVRASSSTDSDGVSMTHSQCPEDANG